MKQHLAGRLTKEDVIFSMIVLNRVGDMKCLRQLVYLYVYMGEHVFVLRLR